MELWERIVGELSKLDLHSTGTKMGVEGASYEIPSTAWAVLKKPVYLILERIMKTKEIDSPLPFA